MASSLKLIIFLFTLVFTVSPSQCRCFRSIISFGDSIADTGNLLSLSDRSHLLCHSAFPPYGETFFHHVTGRFSDGRLIIDFIAEFLGLPYVAPFFANPNGDFRKGINFAVGGATALDRAILEERGIHFPSTNISLGVQLSTFKQILPKLCGSSSDCREMLGNSLILMGEIGGNDFNYPFFIGKSLEEVQELVPLVLNIISSIITELVDMGGKTFLVPGNFPIGCSPTYLTRFRTSNKEEYDPLTGCLNWLNEFAEHYNQQLQIELNRIQKLYPHVSIVYADYYNPISHFYHNPTKFEFMEKPLSACCGDGGPYNCNPRKFCGDPGVRHCEDPSKYVSWDCVHMTEAAYRKVAEDILKKLFSNPTVNSSCLTFKFKDGVLDRGYSSAAKVY